MTRYAVVVDAGSSGSRAFVYSWPDPDRYTNGMLESSVLRKALLPITHESVEKVQPGISSYVGQTPKHVYKKHLKPLLHSAQKNVPRESQADTPIFFLATAGLRLVEEQERNRLLEGVCEYLQKESKFYIGDCSNQVAMIDGQSEGLYGWLGLNYLVHWGISDHWSDFDDTYGFLDMGGASAQLAYASSPDSAHKDDLHQVRIRNAQGDAIEWHVFVTTWLGYGANQARNRFRQELVNELRDEEKQKYINDKAPIPVFDPCLPTGARDLVGPEALSGSPNGSHSSTGSEGDSIKYLFEGCGDWPKCESEVAKLLNDGVECIDEPCLFDGKHVPDFNIGDQKFVGVSEYWYTIEDLFGNKGTFDYSTLEPKVSELCSSDWATIKKRLNKGEFLKGDKSKNIRFTEEDIQRACFKSAWVLTVLNKGFKFPLSPENKQLEQDENKHLEHNFQHTFQSAMDIEDNEISWTLGRVVLYSSSQIAPREGGSSEPVGVTLLNNDFVPGGGHYTNEPGIADVRVQEHSMSAPFIFIVFVVLCVLLMLVFGETELGRYLNKVPLIKRFKRKLRAFFGSDDSQFSTASRIGYGHSYPHADIPLSTLSQDGSRPQFRSPRMSSQNLADHSLM